MKGKILKTVCGILVVTAMMMATGCRDSSSTDSSSTDSSSIDSSSTSSNVTTSTATVNGSGN